MNVVQVTLREETDVALSWNDEFAASASIFQLVWILPFTLPSKSGKCQTPLASQNGAPV